MNKRIVKKYHLRKEVIDYIIVSLVFIGLMLLISEIEMLRF